MKKIRVYQSSKKRMDCIVHGGCKESDMTEQLSLTHSLKKLIVNIIGVNISFAEGAGINHLFKVKINSNSNVTADVNNKAYVNLNNCTVDYANAPSGTELCEKVSMEAKFKVTMSNTVILDNKNYKGATSMTMADGFILNIYVPTAAANSLQTTEYFVINGANYTVDKLTTTTVDGVECYLISIPLNPHEMGKTVSITVYAKRIYSSIDPDQTDRVVQKAIVRTATKINADPITYLEKLTAKSDATVSNLAKDILAYVRSAYDYANKTDSARVMARIDGIIGADYADSSTPNFAEVSLNVDKGLNSARMALGDSPAFIFYPETDAEGNPVYDLSLYTFKVKGYKLRAETATDEEGKTFFVIGMFAYAFDDTVDYSIAGTDISGSYNLSAYYEFAKSLNDAKLTTLIERLCKYAESAEAYADAQKGA